MPEPGAHGPERIDENPYSVRGATVTDGEGGGLGAAAQVQFGQDAVDVVLDGLAGEEQALGQLAVRQPLAEQHEHLALASGELRERTRSAARRGDAEGTQQRSRGVGVAGGAERA